MKISHRIHLLTLPIFLYASLIFPYIAKETSPYLPHDKIFLNCGAQTETTDAYDRKWIPDNQSDLTPAEYTSLTSPAATQHPSVPQVPFMTARIFLSEFTYSFSVQPGRKFIRLYFYPASYANLDKKNAVFHVTCANYTLLTNFSPSQTTHALNFAYIVKEYIVNVEGDRLNLTFKPSTDHYKAYAFVNGIEVVSSPDIYNSETVMVVGQSTSYEIDGSTALETVYRLNVAGNHISPTNDSGLFRSWSDDSPYIFGAAVGVTNVKAPNMTIVYPKTMPEYVAPTDVYSTARTMGPNSQINLNYNLTWIFSVDSGFLYFVRLHFCELQPVINKINQRVFKIFINNQTAESEADVVGWTGGNGIPMYRDYVVLLPSGNGQQDLWLALRPNTASKPMYYDAILNGVEIFKINDFTGNLAGSNPIPAMNQKVIDQSLARKVSTSDISKNDEGVISGGVVGGIAAFALLCFVVFSVSTRWRHGKDYVAIN